MMHSIFRVLKFALQDFFRNFWLSLATLSVIIITLVLVNVVILLNVVKEYSLTALKDKIDISINLKPAVTQAEALELKSLLTKDSRVTTVALITPEENLEQFKKLQPEIADKYLPSVDTNPLGYSLRIKANDVNDYIGILDSLKSNDAYKDKFYDQSIPQYQAFVNTVSAFVEQVNPAALVVIAIFLLIAMIIIFNTIRMNIYTHREEIGIMKLVGATNWFVRTPFLIESILYSVVSLAVVVALIYSGYNFVRIYVQNLGYASFLSSAVDIPPINFIQLFAVQLVIMTLINLVSTSIAIRRYLKV